MTSGRTATRALAAAVAATLAAAGAPSVARAEGATWQGASEGGRSELRLALLDGPDLTPGFVPVQDDPIGAAIAKGRADEERAAAEKERATAVTMHRWAVGLSIAAAVGAGLFAWKGLEVRSLEAKKADLQAGSSAAAANAADMRSASTLADIGLGAAVLTAIPAGVLWWKVTF